MRIAVADFNATWRRLQSAGPVSKLFKCFPMRAIALSVWLFLNLGFFGMCGYIYLIWAQNWRSNGRRVYDIARKSTYNPKDPVIFYETPKLNRSIIKKIRRHESPRTKFAKKKKKKCKGDECDLKLMTLKNDLLLQMRRVLHDESSVFKTDNPYGVDYRGPRASPHGYSASEIRCGLRSAGLRTLNNQDPPFDNLPIGNLLGDGDLFGDQIFRSCAVVSNAGALLDSKSGALIDNHDVVVRFNHAPTESFETDVGTKTSLRIVNSQVVTKPEFALTSAQLYKNLTVVVWDPSDYSASLQEWFEKPDFDFFREWSTYRQANPYSKSAVLDPRSVWRVWDVVQGLTALRIRRNPPSSGFLGLTLMLPYCDYVDIFEFVPSSRMSSRCHYFDDIEDMSCTLGVWHPLAAEKFVTISMNELNDSTLFEAGYARIRGFRNLRC